LDANVLYPARLRDLLIRLAIAGLYQARWSDQILDECFDNLLENRPDLTQEQLARTRQLMTTALPDASVNRPRGPDRGSRPARPRRSSRARGRRGDRRSLAPRHRHLDDFPAERIPEGLRVVSTDEFVLELARDDLDVVVDVVETQAAGLVNPPMTASEVLDGLEAVALVQAVAQIRPAIS
jgi:hypothetical protein